MEEDKVTVPNPSMVARFRAFFDIPNNPRIFHLFLISSSAAFILGVAMIVEWLVHGRHHPGYRWIIHYAPVMILLPFFVWILCLIFAVIFYKPQNMHSQPTLNHDQEPPVMQRRQDDQVKVQEQPPRSEPEPAVPSEKPPESSLPISESRSGREEETVALTPKVKVLFQYPVHDSTGSQSNDSKIYKDKDETLDEDQTLYSEESTNLTGSQSNDSKMSEGKDEKQEENPILDSEECNLKKKDDGIVSKVVVAHQPVAPEKGKSGEDSNDILRRSMPSTYSASDKNSIMTRSLSI